MSRVKPTRGSKADEFEGAIGFNVPLRERVAAIAGGADVGKGAVDAVGDVEEFVVGLCGRLLVYVWGKYGGWGSAYRDCDFASGRSASDDGDLVLRAKGAVGGDRCHGQCTGSIGERVRRDLVVELRNHKEVGSLLAVLVGPEGAVAGTTSHGGCNVGEGRHIVGVARAGDEVDMKDIAAEIGDHGKGAGGVDEYSVGVGLALTVSDDGAHVVGELLVLLEYPVVGHEGVDSLAAAGETLVWTEWGREGGREHTMRQ
jgi:hypothetical protein